MKTRNQIFYRNIASLLLFEMIFLSSVYAQDTSVMVSSPEIKVKSSEWQLLANNEFVAISYKYEECNLPSQGSHDEFVYLQLKNKTTNALTIEWNTEYWYNEKCYGCEANNNENHFTIQLMPNTILEGVCAENVNPALKILSKMLNIETKTVLTDFSLRDIKITVNK
jgi:uncharacterized protein YcfL